MYTDIREKPRVFTVNRVDFKDVGKICLEENEMISLLSDSGKEVDITAKEWGYYLGPSLNGRLEKEGYKTALVVNEYNKIFVMVVDIEKIDKFKKYLFLIKKPYGKISFGKQGVWGLGRTNCS